MTRPKLYTRSATTAATAAMLGTVVIGAKTLTFRGAPAGTAEAPWEKGRTTCRFRPASGRSSQLFRAFVWGAAGATTARMRRCLDKVLSRTSIAEEMREERRRRALGE